jgi:hemerythrin-like domain-containing protein
MFRGGTDLQEARDARKDEKMKPSEVLVKEHEIICKVLDAAERVAGRIEKSGEVPVGKVRQIMSFVREFADGCHHAKEENHLFVQMNRHGMPMEQGPIAVMNHEHDLGRGFMKALGAALDRVERGDKSATAAVVENMLGYVELLRAHIFKENNILFPMADHLLPDATQAELSEAFDRVDSDADALRKKYIAFATELAATA